MEAFAEHLVMEAAVTRLVAPSASHTPQKRLGWVLLPLTPVLTNANLSPHESGGCCLPACGNFPPFLPVQPSFLSGSGPKPVASCRVLGH